MQRTVPAGQVTNRSWHGETADWWTDRQLFTVTAKCRCGSLQLQMWWDGSSEKQLCTAAAKYRYSSVQLQLYREEMTVEEKQLVRAAAMYRNRSLQLQLQHFTDRSLHYSCSHVQKQVFTLQLQPCTETGLYITAAAMYRNRSLHYSCSHVQKQVFTLQLQPCTETGLHNYSCSHVQTGLYITAAAM